MPIITHRRKLVSYIKDALIAPFIFVLVAAIHGWWVFVVMAVCFAICLALGGAGVAPTWDYRETLIICAGVYFVIFFAALLLSLGEYLFTDRLEQVWIPDERCLDISRSFAERLIARDFHGVFDLLSPEYRARLTVDDLITAFDDQCRRYGVPEAVAVIQELRSASPSPESGACAVTQVDMTCAPGKKCTRATSILTLQLYLNSEDERYKIVAVEYVPACLASDSEDFHAGFDYVPQAAVHSPDAYFVFCHDEVELTRRMIRDALIKRNKGDDDGFDFCPPADAEEIDADDWDGFQIHQRQPGDWALVRCHRGPVVGNLLAGIAQVWNPDDPAMGQMREEDFDQAFEVWSSYSGHDCLGDEVCECLINMCHGILVVPWDDLLMDPNE